MDISLERSAVCAYREVSNESKYCEISSDHVVPDTMEDIERIIKTNAAVRIKSKDIDASGVHIGGEICGELLYFGEDETVPSVLDFSVPFDCDTDIRDVDFVLADMRICALDSRLQNPRKINIRAEVEVMLRCYSKEKAGGCCGIKDIPDKLFVRKKTSRISRPIFMDEKQFGLDEVFELSGICDEPKLLCAKSRYKTDNVEQIGSKLILKGHAEFWAMISDDKGNIASQSFTTSFSQLFELCGEDEISTWNAVVLPTAEYYSIENGELRVESQAVTQLSVSAEAEIEYLDDAYFCGKSLNIEYETLKFNRDTEVLERHCDTKLSADTAERPTAILSSYTRVGRFRREGDSISAPITAEVLYKANDDRISTAVLRGNAEFESCDGYIKAVEIESLTAVILESGIELQLKAVLRFEQTDSVQLKYISAMTAEDTECKELPSLYLCRKGERELWELAKRYSSSEKLILSVNALEDTPADPHCLLIIPRL